MSANLIREFSQSSQLGSNAAYIEHLYEAWLDSPASVPNDWQAYFRGLPGGGGREIPHSVVIGRIENAQRERERRGSGMAVPVSDAHAQAQAGVLRLLTAYRSRGHLDAHTDPLGLKPKINPPDLGLAYHGLSNADLDTEFDTGSYCGGDAGRMKLSALWQHLKDTYTGSIGAEFMHISDHQQRRWVYSRLEQVAGKPKLSRDEQLRILERLVAANGHERFLHTKYVGQKRFSLEGGDSLIPLVDSIIRMGGASGVKEIVIGMAHRGRLNMLVNVLGKAPQELFDEFEGKLLHPNDPDYTGDVKYHLGFSADVVTEDDKDVHLALAFNPSHLEIVDPVVEGSVRARQTRRRDKDLGEKEVLPILVHGDASFTGQGVVMETLQMSELRGFGVGGTIHVMVNNQVGFTISDPRDSRSTLYSTDVAKFLGAPIFHVNGDDPEAVIQVAKLAFEFQRTFKKDVVVDIVCYRRNGHNEADEPAATQPTMYSVIRKHPTPAAIYAEKLEKAGIIDDAYVQELTDTYRKRMEAGKPVTKLAKVQNGGSTPQWEKHAGGTLDEQIDTGVARKDLDRLAKIILQAPEGFRLHSRVQHIYDERRKMAAGDKPLDWGYAENMAYASIINQGYDFRLVGQDSGRGTFFHRHAVLHDQPTGNTDIPLTHIDDARSVEVIDSFLSENGAMGFEYGYASTDPDTLCIWEAQFGDFANGAQVVIDQFVSAAEAKWDRLCGLVLLLPHGYEGQGPEHSSARLERYLQLCALNNMQVCIPTTPAQAFHLLRRQMLRKVRKPLIVMSPKSLLRHKLAVSSLDDLAKGSFQMVINDELKAPVKQVKRVILCAGKVYYDLFEAAQQRKLKNVAIARVEQLYPFPRDLVKAQLQRYSGAKEVVWCQEEPMNQGAWFQVRHHLQACLGDNQTLSYAGRQRSPTPACGNHKMHAAEQNALVEQALVEPVDTRDNIE